VVWDVEYTDEFGAWWDLLADRLYDEHLKELEKEATKHGKTL
jgi:hypothetical protein